MPYTHLSSLIASAPLATLDTLSRDVWQAVGAGSLTETQAQELAEAIHGRRKPHPQAAFISLENSQVVSSQTPSRMASGAPGTPSAKPPRPWSYFPTKQPQRSPDRARSVERRRTLAASGPLPPKLACKFTTGELAVLKVVADECASGRQCTLSIPEIAARSGVGRTTTRRALRIAQNLGLVSITERRVHYQPNLTNVVRIVSPEWLHWVARWKPRSRAPEGVIGAKTKHSVRTPGRSTSRVTEPSATPRQGEGSLLRGPRNQGFTRRRSGTAAA